MESRSASSVGEAVRKHLINPFLEECWNGVPVKRKLQNYYISVAQCILFGSNIKADG